MLEQLLEQQLPKLSAHLRSLSLSVPFVTTQWFLCLFLNALPSESCFRVWDLIFCLHPCTIFQVAIALFGSMEEQSLLEATDIGPAVFVIRSATRSCFDVSRLFALAQNRFHEVTPLPHPTPSLTLTLTRTRTRTRTLTLTLTLTLTPTRRGASRC